MALPCQDSIFSSSRSSIRARGSSPAVGSSMMSTGGSCSSALATLTRCFMPPESWYGYAPANRARPTFSMYRAAMLSRLAASTPCMRSP